MPRDNNKAFDCRECRFNIKGECRRNPPVPFRYEVDNGFTTYEKIKGEFPPADSGCFAGEPIEDRSCSNCKEFYLCNVRYERFDCPKEQCVGWHCSDWVLEKGVSE